jgi:RNA polymerase sigma-70 factor (ECF subfamily)
VSLALSETPGADDDFIGRCRAGDVAGWRALYDRYFPQVFRIAQRIGVPDRDLGDVCQEVFLRVHRGLATFRGEAQFSTWLYRIVLNESARHGRSATLRRAVATLLGRDDHGVHAGPPPRPDEVLARGEAALDLAWILAGMRPRQREVFVLFELEELSLAEIAEVLDCGLETVRSRLRQGPLDFEGLLRQRQLSGARGQAAMTTRRP